MSVRRKDIYKSEVEVFLRDHYRDRIQIEAAKMKESLSEVQIILVLDFLEMYE